MDFSWVKVIRLRRGLLYSRTCATHFTCVLQDLTLDMGLRPNHLTLRASNIVRLLRIGVVYITLQAVQLHTALGPLSACEA